MDVYFIPVAADRYELYCDPDVGADEAILPDEAPKGRLAALYASFKDTLARVEEERLSGERRDDGPRSWSERLKARALGWIAEKIAEQRLLWRLRNESELRLHYPDDMAAENATSLARAELQREADRHMKWMIIDGALFVASGVFFFVPGPNLIAYYFGFRLVGHYLSRRGARHALTGITWDTCPSPQLSRLRRLLVLAPHERDRELHEVASALRLPHLAKFFERTSMKAA